METVEILAGGEFANAVKSLGLTSAVCTIFAMKLGLLPSAMFALARLIWHGKTT